MIPLPLLQFFCLLGVVVGGLFYRYRLIDEPYSLGLLMINLLGLVILSIIAIYSVMTHTSPFAPRPLSWLVFSALPVAFIAIMFWQSLRVPAIHDITTDTQSPPAFLEASALRKSYHHSVDYDKEVAQQQLSAYPDITSQAFSQDASTVFNKIVTLAAELDWQVVDMNIEQGRLEAYSVTPLLGFVDDIVVRVGREDKQTVVDVRSQSRIGKSDLGANAKRIRLFQQKLSHSLAE